MPRPGSAEPRRSTWNMAPDPAGVRPPLNTRPHGHGRADPSDDPSAGPRDRGLSEQTPAPRDHPRAGLVSVGSGLRFDPSRSHPVERAARARRVADGIRALVTARLSLCQVLPVDGAAREGASPAGDMRVRVPRGTSRSVGGRRQRSGRHGACPRRRPVACADTGAGPHNSSVGRPGPRPPDWRWTIVASCGPACRLPIADDEGHEAPASAGSGRASPPDPLLRTGWGQLFRMRSNRLRIDGRQTDFGSAGCLSRSLGEPRSWGSSASCLWGTCAPPVKSGPCDPAVLTSLSGADRSAAERSVGPDGERWVRTPSVTVCQRAERSARVRRCRSVAGTRGRRPYAVSGSASAGTRTSVPRGTSLGPGQGARRRCESRAVQCPCPAAGDTGADASAMRPDLVRLPAPGCRGEASTVSEPGRCPRQPTAQRVQYGRDGGSGHYHAALLDDRPWGDRSMPECLSVSCPGGRP
jgi:hypothetical protein